MRSGCGETVPRAAGSAHLSCATCLWRIRKSSQKRSGVGSLVRCRHRATVRIDDSPAHSRRPPVGHYRQTRAPGRSARRSGRILAAKAPLGLLRAARRIKDEGALPIIPSRSNATKKAYCPKRFYRRRHKIENYFCRIKDWRRIATRYDKLARNFLSATMLVGALCWIRL